MIPSEAHFRIQAILLALILVLAFVLLRYLRRRSRLSSRLVLVGFVVILAIFILFPNITTQIANLFGVGRGVDFLFYLFALFILYILSMLYIKLRDQDRKFTQVTRSLALRDARSYFPTQEDFSSPKAGDSESEVPEVLFRRFRNIHPSADISPQAVIGQGTRIWHNCQVREGARIGDNCSLGKGVYIDRGVEIGSQVKIQNYVSIYEGVTVEDGVFIGPQVCFTNDLEPRAVNPDGSLKSNRAGTDWILTKTLVRSGVSLGAASTIVCGVTINEWALVGAGSVVTHDVPAYGLVYGNPARLQGYICPCGGKLLPGSSEGVFPTFPPGSTLPLSEYSHTRCDRCGRIIELRELV